MMWRAHFANMQRDLGFTSSLGDPYIWMRAASKENSFSYYEFILVYVDNLLVISHQAKQIIEALETDYDYHLNDVGPPKRYLGATIGRYDCNGQNTWFMSAEQYLERALPIIEEQHGQLKRYKVDTPLPTNYHLELDQSHFLQDDKIKLYQSYICVLRWAVELGHIDLTHPVSLMARFAACPRENRFKQLILMFAYIKKHL